MMKSCLLEVGFLSTALFLAVTVSSLPQTCVAFHLPVFTPVAKRNRLPLLLMSSPSSDNNDEPSLPSSAKDIVTTCMDALLQNDSPWDNAGLEVCFDFSSDRCRAALGGSLDDFIAYASNPTFSPLANAKEYSVVSVGPVIAATMTRGAMQTVLIKVKPSKGGDRTFLWTIQQERRPPRQGLWLIHDCIFVENAFALTE